ncbi:hypothetical protein [Planomonospora venezuelensis]|uniref:Uncharacterized protein n=1 Tax=Planomonospora venezuelensis TaxID=1999 RepID=A0A841D241_PLAVE|nr:hypothetical protein [Planomonospora venezuelensis]MBB5964321.1 hypothetical protein [Planomonospora venezuelensis]
MTHPDQPAVPGGKPSWSRPPAWLRALGVPVALVAALQTGDERGPLMGAAAGAVYGSLALGLLAWDRFMLWSREHPALDVLGSGPVMFLVVALATPLPLVACAAVAAAATALLAVLGHLRRRRPPGPEARPLGRS